MSVVAVTPPGAQAPPSPSVARLGREFRHLCAQATQPEEIAAALESNGLNDDIARERYGLQNVFACAEALYTHLPYRAPRSAVGTETGPLWGLLPRGLLYALPGAALAVAGPLLSGLPGASVALFSAVVLGWGWGQGMASIGYRKTGAPQQWFLWRATALSGPLTALAGALVAALNQPRLDAALIGALVGWVGGTTCAAFAALLILGRPLFAALGFLPCLALLVAPALSGAGPTDWNSAWVALGCAALLPLAALGVPTRLPSGLQIPPPPWHVTLAHAGAGWLCALFLTLAFGAALWAQLGPAALLPVILSVGPLEVVSLRFQSRLRLLAHRYGDLRRLAGASQRALLGLWGAYLLALGSLYGLYLLTPLLGTWPGSGVLLTALLPLAAYGSALLLGTVVSSVGQPWVVCAAWLLGSLVYLLCHAAGLAAAPLLGALFSVGVLWLGVLRVLRVPATYR
ncbi:hypothetical protein [Deinococcus koreensis]|uniref:Uncharacterized protein n=1 Tax=Deinococcus koreensis TaxID=2054903 RepID=A0A2K3USR0_9DEIO|nr:hypothetical protein [Deinococcus koreensis]PNY79572.1 hypothetical protein CVO96_19300 [Deinococcus koreensis]